MILLTYSPRHRCPSNWDKAFGVWSPPATVYSSPIVLWHRSELDTIFILGAWGGIVPCCKAAACSQCLPCLNSCAL